MIRKTFVATIAAAVLTADGAFAAVLDANHATTGSANNNSNAGAIMASLGQTFTVLGNGTLDSVSFNILNIGNDGNGAATGDVTFDIRSTLAGGPLPNAASALFSTTISNSDIGVLDGSIPHPWTTIVVDVSSANISVSTGDIFAFILTTTIGQEFAVQTDFGSAYAGGQRVDQAGDGNAFFSSPAADLSFATYIEPPQVPLPAALPLLLAGLGGLGLVARRTSRAA